jgi:hypothetical protein
MKPIFTIHAGEYLVAAEIEKKFKEYNIWLPSKDTGIDLLLTNANNKKTVSLQVKFSKDFNPTNAKEIFRPYIRGAGWWKLNRSKIENSKADFWVFLLYSFENKNHDCIIIKPIDLLSIFTNTARTANTIHCYITISNHSTAFETRGLGDTEMHAICNNSFSNRTRNLNKYLNNWKPLTQGLK